MRAAEFETGSAPGSSGSFVCYAADAKSRRIRPVAIGAAIHQSNAAERETRAEARILLERAQADRKTRALVRTAPAAIAPPIAPPTKTKASGSAIQILTTPPRGRTTSIGLPFIFTVGIGSKIEYRQSISTVLPLSSRTRTDLEPRGSSCPSTTRRGELRKLRPRKIRRPGAKSGCDIGILVGKARPPHNESTISGDPR